MDRNQFIEAMIRELSMKEKSANMEDCIQENSKYAFEQLCYDYPQVPVADLKCLINHLLKQLERGRNKATSVSIPYIAKSTPLRINRSFIDGLIYVSSSVSRQNFEGKEIENNNNDSNIKEKQPKAISEYSELCAIVLIKLFRNMELMNLPTLQCLVGNYMIKEEPNNVMNTIEKNKIFDAEIENMIEKSIETVNCPTVIDDNDGGLIYAAEEDPDDFVYEGSISINNLEGDEMYIEDFSARFGNEANIKTLKWTDIRNKVSAITSNLTYELIAGISEKRWNDLNLTKDIEILVQDMMKNENCSSVTSMKRQSLFIAVMQDNDTNNIESAVELRSHWPRFIFLLRDRILHYPNNVSILIQKIFSLLESGLRTREDELIAASLTQEDCVGLLVLASLVGNPSFTTTGNCCKSLQSWIRSILPWLTLLLDEKVSVLTKMSKDINLDSVDSTITTQLEQISKIIEIIEYYVGRDGLLTNTDIIFSNILIESGLLRGLIQLLQDITLKTWNIDTKLFRRVHRLLQLLCQKSLEKYASYIVNFRPLVDCIISNPFREQHASLYCIWTFIFASTSIPGIYSSQKSVVQPADSVMYDTLIEKYFTDIKSKLIEAKSSKDCSLDYLKDLDYIWSFLADSSTILNLSKKGNTTVEEQIQWFYNWIQAVHIKNICKEEPVENEENQINLNTLQDKINQIDDKKNASKVHLLLNIRKSIKTLICGKSID